MSDLDSIIVRGARVHNLKNIDFEIPHNALTVVTGVSGSGKSSLAFDTIYAEGQRRYVESVSAYARQFLERMEKPDVDEITGIAPAIAIKQKNTTRSQRSTVATATEIYDYLRLLFARVGRTYCSSCGVEIHRDSVDEVAHRLLTLPLKEGETRRCQVLFPVERHGMNLHLDDNNLKERLFDLRKRGFSRLFQKGRVFEFSTPESLLEIDFTEPVFVLADRLVLSASDATDPAVRQRIIDAIESCYREGGESIWEMMSQEAEARLRFSERFECKNCGAAAQEPEPHLFSFNSPFGACPRCQGFGNTIDFDMDLVIPDKLKKLEDGAIEPWTKPKYKQYYAELKRHAKSLGIRLNVPYCDLTQEERDLLYKGQGQFPGIKGFFDYLERKKYKLHVRVFVSRYRGYTLCPECQGWRLRREALNVRVGGKNIGEVCRLTIELAGPFFRDLQLSPMHAEIAGRVLEEIQARVQFLQNTGLEYLTLDRLAATLSGGEAQRIQLATSLGSRLVGALYVLDEPSIGLHPRDTGRLIGIMHALRDLGNTILVVEHDRDVMHASDYILDLGPGAGENGGRVVFAGPYSKLFASTSLTGLYLKNGLRIAVPEKRRPPQPKNQLKIVGATIHNLRGLDVAIPLGMMVAITGVSGSGKSTLVHQVLYQGLRAMGVGMGDAAPLLTTTSSDEAVIAQARRMNCRRIDGAKLVKEIVLVDQSPIGRTPRSNPVTYIKAFDAIRETFAATPEAKRRNYNSGHFSFNIPGGRCEACQGDGTVTVEMQFLADVELICEECGGTRFKSGVLEVRYRGKNVHEVLQMTVHEAIGFFTGVPKVSTRLRVLDEVGLGYLRLGQPASTLSGGEAQRVKLAAHLTQGSAERVLYLFDEPTTGLHFDDINKLLTAFRKLVEAGSSILIIEHNLDVIKCADWVIDLGPEGGVGGGHLVAEGTPEAVAKVAASHTGRYLTKVLA
jgi:excinuclease ABC subunit A